MRKFILFVFTLTLGLSNNQSLFEIKEITNDKIVISFTLKEYQLKNNNGYTEIVAPHLLGTKSLIGEPLLPSISSFVQLDKYTSYIIELYLNNNYLFYILTFY